MRMYAKRFLNYLITNTRQLDDAKLRDHERRRQSIAAYGKCVAFSTAIPAPATPIVPLSKQYVDNEVASSVATLATVANPHN